jgi:hypothetical protein
VARDIPIARHRFRSEPGNQGIFNLGKIYHRRVRDGRISNIQLLNSQELTQTLPMSESHCWDLNWGRPPYDKGSGLFIKEVSRAKGVQGSGDYLLGFTAASGAEKTEIRYTGGWHRPYIPPVVNAAGLEGILAGTNPSTFNSEANPNDLSERGDRAWNVLRPKPERVNLGQAIGEAGDIPKLFRGVAKRFANATKRGRSASEAKSYSQLWRRLNGNPKGWKQVPKRVSDNFLEIQFGWVPFVSDIAGAYATATAYSAAVAKAKARNDKWQKRIHHEDEILEETTIYTDNGLNVVSGLTGQGIVSGTARYTVTRRRVDRIWYEGVFKYYYKELDGTASITDPIHPAFKAVGEAAQLFGARVNPTTIYNVMPWTWAVDWFSNTGDALQRYEDLITNQVASKYMYLMRHIHYEYEFRQEFTMKDGQALDLKWYISIDTKRRAPASSAFGFSLSEDAWSPGQWAIAGALGLSRGNRYLLS